IAVRETPTPARAGGGNSPWRAQLGAFGVEANARSLWASLGKKYPAVAARQPTYVKTGKVTRLQTAGFANKGEANNFCAALSKSGQACLVVDK
ncbi:MAG: SPOR domain-containing protein, partial [Sphingopyxis sp.]|nr:SPOR domain-containing protein [Sphingopyxis sp.]